MKIFSLALACLALSACVDSEEASDADDASLSDDTIVYDSVATVSPDGEVVMQPPRAITVGEQRAQNQVRLDGIAANGYTPTSASNGEQDFACGYDSLWVYSRTDFTGDRICFHGEHYFFYMRDYARFTTINGHAYYAGTWQILQGSFISGVRPGTFYSYIPSIDRYTWRSFSPTTSYVGTFSFANPLTQIYID